MVGGCGHAFKGWTKVCLGQSSIVPCRSIQLTSSCVNRRSRQRCCLHTLNRACGCRASNTAASAFHSTIYGHGHTPPDPSHPTNRRALIDSQHGFSYPAANGDREDQGGAPRGPGDHLHQQVRGFVGAHGHVWRGHRVAGLDGYGPGGSQKDRCDKLHAHLGAKDNLAIPIDSVITACPLPFGSPRCFW